MLAFLLKKFEKIRHISYSFFHKKKTKNTLSKNPIGCSIWKAFQNTKNTEKSVQSKKFEVTNRYRKKLSADSTKIDYSSFNLKEKKVKEVYNTASSPQIWGQFYYELAESSRARHIFEIGSNLGVSGSYFILSLNNRVPSYFITYEGVPDLCAYCERQFSKIADKKCTYKIVQGLYRDTLSNIHIDVAHLDMIFIDGNHQKEATLDYFQKLKPYAKPSSLFLFDDIYWSRGMRLAWEKIKGDIDVLFTVDFFKLGVVVLREKNDTSPTKHFKLFLAN